MSRSRARQGRLPHEGLNGRANPAAAGRHDEVPWRMIGAAGPPSATNPPGRMTTNHDPSVTLAVCVNLQAEGRNQVRSQMSEYEITFAGRYYSPGL